MLPRYAQRYATHHTREYLTLSREYLSEYLLEIRSKLDEELADSDKITEFGEFETSPNSVTFQTRTVHIFPVNELSIVVLKLPLIFFCSENSEIIFKTKKMNVFLEWEWDVTNEVCAICRNEMVDSCMRIGLVASYISLRYLRRRNSNRRSRPTCEYL